MTTDKPLNGASIREVYALIDSLNDKVDERFDRLLRDVIGELDKRDQKMQEHLGRLHKEIYGEGDSRGLRGRIGDLEKNTGLAHGLLVALTALGSAIAAWLGMKN